MFTTPTPFTRMIAVQKAPLFRGLFLLAAGFLHGIATGQNAFEHGPFKLQRFTEMEGLVSSQTTDTYNDSRGFLWISTFQGLSRFDGRSFENFGKQNGLSESNVDLLGEDAAGQIFIKSVSTIYRYTGAKDKSFVKYPSNDKFINAACPDGRNKVWVAYDGEKRLLLLSADSQLASLATASPVYQLVKANDGGIYVLEYSGQVSILKDGKLTPVYTIHAKQPYTNEGIRIFKDPKGTIWTYGANNEHLYAINGKSVTDSIKVPRNTRWWQWWVGSSQAVYYASDTGSVFQLNKGEWQMILGRQQVRGSIYEVKEDENGILWITASGGLLKITRKQYKNVEARSPDWYYTTDPDGRYILKSDSLLYTLPNAVNCFYKLQPEVLTNVYVARNKDVWYCTEQSVYFLPYGKPLQKLNTANTYEGTKFVFRFRRVLEDGAGGVFISSYHGIFHKQGKRLSYYWDREGITEGALYTIALDRNGLFYTAGIHVFALVNGKFINVSKQLSLANEISRLTTDKNGALWLSQEGVNKLVKIGYAGGRFVIADSVSLSVNGIPFTPTSISFDAENNLWLCDHQSLFCFPKTDTGYLASPVYFDEEFFGEPLIYADDSGQLQVLSHPLAGNYLRTYSAQKLLRLYRPKTPTVHLTGISLFKHAFDWNAAGFATDILGVPQNLKLKHNQNFLRFSFTGLTPEFNRSIAYRYRLVGYDGDWSPATNQSEAEYTGLPPGLYSFEVEARSAGGQWSKPFRYTFEVGQVWYLTLWAKLLWTVLGFALLGGFLYYRFQSYKRKQSVKQMLVQEQLKALRAQINPHFLQNTFAFLAHELYAAQNTKAIKAIDRLSVYLKHVLRFSDKAAVTLEEELEFADEYLQMQQQLLSTAFTYTISVPDDLDVFDIYVPSMLLQPIIENAIKYGIDVKIGGHITITVTLHYPYVRCVISDTGRQTPALEPLPYSSSGKGLALTKDRMELFYHNKRNKPQFYRAKNENGGCNAIVLIPIA